MANDRIGRGVGLSYSVLLSLEIDEDEDEGVGGLVPCDCKSGVASVASLSAAPAGRSLAS